LFFAARNPPLSSSACTSPSTSVKLGVADYCPIVEIAAIKQQQPASLAPGTRYPITIPKYANAMIAAAQRFMVKSSRGVHCYYV
jgi:hypothetical protein